MPEMRATHEPDTWKKKLNNNHITNVPPKALNANYSHKPTIGRHLFADGIKFLDERIKVRLN